MIKSQLEHLDIFSGWQNHERADSPGKGRPGSPDTEVAVKSENICL